MRFDVFSLFGEDSETFLPRLKRVISLSTNYNYGILLHKGKQEVKM